MIATERDLVAVAASLIGDGAQLSSRERSLLKSLPTVSTDLVESTRALIAAGDDPLGELFGQLRSPETRREVGATYTPAAIVAAMVAWAAGEAEEPTRVVDPGCGSGRYLMASAQRFPKAALIGVDTDPLALLLLRANAAVQGFADRLTVKLLDYRRLTLPPVDGPTLFIGNPPYVRHHDISESWKEWFAETATGLGFTASKLAGLHIHFFLKTRKIGRPGDFGAFITAAEWMDVNYGSVLRQMLADGLGGTSLHLIDPKAQPFVDALATGAITCFRLGRRPNQFTLRSVDTLDQLGELTTGKAVPWSDLAKAPKWTPFLRPAKVRPSGHIELGELFRVHRGTVTGSNAVWIAGAAAAELPARFLRPAVTKARELIEAGDVLRRVDRLRSVVDLPIDLSELDRAERKAVDRFLAWAKRMGGHESYVATHRRAWWSVGYRDPAAILCTYMARRPPHFVRNAAGVCYLNIAHGLYPRERLPVKTLEHILRFLQSNSTVDGGRTYAGGLVKFEPKELERLTIPSLEQLNEVAAEMDARRAGTGRRNVHNELSA